MPSAPQRFGYYRRLSAKDRAIYRRSDAITSLALHDPPRVGLPCDAIEAALREDDRRAVQRASQALSRAVCEDLGVSVVPVRVLARRPADATGELHGLYERHEDGRTLIRVWMRTAAHERVVAFRTYLRTLVHELCHHLDYEHLRLADSYHTRGFFQRESSLVRQLRPAPEIADEGEPRDPSPQLALPGFG